MLMADRRDVPLPVRVAPSLLERVDAARGDVSRSRFVVRALEVACRRVEGGVEVGRAMWPTEADVPQFVRDAEAYAKTQTPDEDGGVQVPVWVPEQAKRPVPAPRLAVRQGKGVFTPRPKGKS